MTDLAAVHTALEQAATHREKPLAMVNEATGDVIEIGICATCLAVWPCADAVYGAMLYAAWRKERTES